MHLIVYISDYTGSPETIEADLRSICATAKKRNPEHGITGALFYHNGNFLQAIEGDKYELNSLIMRLAHDPRHENLTRVVNSPISNRGFSDWNMDTFNLDSYKTIDREAVIRYERAFSRQCMMDSRMFIELLKSMHADESLSGSILAEA